MLLPLAMELSPRNSLLVMAFILSPYLFQPEKYMQHFPEMKLLWMFLKALPYAPQDTVFSSACGLWKFLSQVPTYYSETIESPLQWLCHLETYPLLFWVVSIWACGHPHTSKVLFLVLTRETNSGQLIIDLLLLTKACHQQCEDRTPEVLHSTCDT